MLSIPWAFLTIVFMTLVSKSLRSLAFGRADSIALDVSICSFLYALLSGLFASETFEVFLHGELMRCLVLLLFAFVIAATHRHYKDLCMAGIRTHIARLRAVWDHRASRGTVPTEGSLEDTVLDEAELLAEQSIEVWYSQFADKLFYRFLRRADSDDVRSFKKKKSRIRWSFANLLNHLGIMDENDVRLNDKDFNIDNRSQILGMVIFDTLMILSVLVAVRIL